MVKLTKFMFLLIISLFAFVQEGISAAIRYPNATHPDYPGNCYSEDKISNDTIILKAGQKKRGKYGCFHVECSIDYSLTVLGCGAYPKNVEHCRYIPGDLSKPYPDCCAEYIC